MSYVELIDKLYIYSNGKKLYLIFNFIEQMILWKILDDVLISYLITTVDEIW